MEILRNTQNTSQSVASAMAAVCSFWELGPKGSGYPYGCRAQVETIQELYPTLSMQYDQACDHIGEHWNEIVVNDVLQAELNRFLADMETFRKMANDFEMHFCEHDWKAFDMFDDAWIARKYFVMMLEKAEQYAAVLKIMESFKKRKPSAARPFRGIARELAAYLTGVTDKQIEDLVLNHKPVLGQPWWNGDRDEAVIFAKVFGLTAAQMNKSFKFRGRQYEHRPLSLSGDAPTLSNENYGIWSCLLRYKHCWLQVE